MGGCSLVRICCGLRNFCVVDTMTRPYDAPSNGFGFTAPRRRAGDYTPPGDAMAPLAALLARQPSAMIPALVGALVDRMGPVRASRLIQTMMEIAK